VWDESVEAVLRAVTRLYACVRFDWTATEDAAGFASSGRISTKCSAT
jgi:hypothetical protein